MHDANFNVTALANIVGGIVERFTQEPFGKPTILTPTWTVRSASLYDWVYLHQGGRYTQVLGQFHYRNRDLNAAYGRWTRIDPIRFGGGDMDLYRHIGNNPINAKDPHGMATCCCVEKITYNRIPQFRLQKEIQQKGYPPFKIDQTYNEDVKGKDVVIIHKVTVDLKYINIGGNEDLDCKLQWLEGHNYPVLTGKGDDPKTPRAQLKLEDRYAQFGKNPAVFIWDGWNNRKKPCPGKESVSINDPTQTTRLTHDAILTIKVIIESGSKEKCGQANNTGVLIEQVVPSNAAMEASSEFKYLQ